MTGPLLKWLTKQSSLKSFCHVTLSTPIWTRSFVNWTCMIFTKCADRTKKCSFTIHSSWRTNPNYSWISSARPIPNLTPLPLFKLPLKSKARRPQIPPKNSKNSKKPKMPKTFKLATCKATTATSTSTGSNQRLTQPAAYSLKLSSHRSYQTRHSWLLLLQQCWQPQKIFPFPSKFSPYKLPSLIQLLYTTKKKFPWKRVLNQFQIRV